MSDKQLYGVQRKENDIREYADDGTMYYSSESIEKEIPENMRFKECNTTLENDGGIYWVTQEAFSYDDLKKFQAAMIKFDIPTAFVTVRDLSPSYRFRYDIDNSPIVEITHDYIDFDVYNSRCEKQGEDEYCIYPSEMELIKNTSDHIDNFPCWRWYKIIMEIIVRLWYYVLGSYQVGRRLAL